MPGCEGPSIAVGPSGRTQHRQYTVHLCSVRVVLCVKPSCLSIYQESWATELIRAAGEPDTVRLRTYDLQGRPVLKFVLCATPRVRVRVGIGVGVGLGLGLG